MPELYPIRAVSKITGIPVDTLRAWERRFKVVSPVRTPRGRLYGEAEIRRLLLLRNAVRSGLSIGQVASFTDAELEELEREARALAEQRPFPIAAPATVPALRPILESIATYNFAQANEELVRLALLLEPADLVHNVILPVMRLAGDYWEKGIFQVSQEHMLSACVRNLLGSLIRHRRGRTGRRGVLLCTPAGELHEFGILAAAILASGEGLQVSYLGPSLPWSDIRMAAENSASDAVILGIVNVDAAPAMRDELHMLASSLPEATEIWVGGGGAEEALAGFTRKGLFVLDDFSELEGHLGRIGS